MQTPQGFQTELLRRAYQRDGAGAVTDDSSLVENLGTPCTPWPVIRWLKITTPLDLRLARAVLDV